MSTLEASYEAIFRILKIFDNYILRERDYIRYEDEIISLVKTIRLGVKTEDLLNHYYDKHVLKSKDVHIELTERNYLIKPLTNIVNEYLEAKSGIFRESHDQMFLWSNGKVIMKCDKVKDRPDLNELCFIVHLSNIESIFDLPSRTKVWFNDT